MGTFRSIHTLADIDVASTYGLALDDGLPGGLAVTAVLLIIIAIWSLAGARGVRDAT